VELEAAADEEDEAPYEGAAEEFEAAAEDEDEAP